MKLIKVMQIRLRLLTEESKNLTDKSMKWRQSLNNTSDFMKVLKSTFRSLMKERYLRKKDQAIFMRSSKKHHNQQSIFSDFSIIILINSILIIINL